MTNDKVKDLEINIIKYAKDSDEYKAYLQGHKEANEYLLVYIANQENQEPFNELKEGAENILTAIDELLK